MLCCAGSFFVGFVVCRVVCFVNTPRVICLMLCGDVVWCVCDCAGDVFVVVLMLFECCACSHARYCSALVLGVDVVLWLEAVWWPTVCM